MVVINALIIASIAVFVTSASAVIAHKASKEKRKKELQEKIKKYSELAKDAEHLGDKKMYHVINKQGNEAIHDFFTTLYLEAVGELAFHALAMGFVQRTFPDFLILKFPVSIGAWVGIGPASWYIFCALLFHFKVVKPAKKKLKFFQISQ